LTISIIQILFTVALVRVSVDRGKPIIGQRPLHISKIVAIFEYKICN